MAIREAGGSLVRWISGRVASLEDLALSKSSIDFFNFRGDSISQLFCCRGILLLDAWMNLTELRVILDELEEMRLAVIVVLVHVLNVAFSTEGIGSAEVHTIINICSLNVAMVIEESVLRVTWQTQFDYRSSLLFVERLVCLVHLQSISGHLDSNPVVADSAQVDVIEAEECWCESPFQGLPDVVRRISKQVSINLERSGVLLSEKYALSIATFGWTMIKSTKPLLEHDFCHLDWVDAVGAKMRVPDEIRLLTWRHGDLGSQGAHEILFVLGNVPFALLLGHHVLGLNVFVDRSRNLHGIDLVHLLMNEILEIWLGGLGQLLAQFLQLQLSIYFFNLRIFGLALLIQ